MNGSWYAWSQQPEEYVAAFRIVASNVHRLAPDTAMVWAPNYGGGYPFRGGAFEATPGSRAFALLDTDRDGVLTMYDDPYGPYYPGDDAVDWFGMSIYHWGAKYPWGENELPEPDKFRAQITGTYSGTAGDETPVPDFNALAALHAKPLGITETASFYAPGAPGEAETPIKEQWWDQVFGSIGLPELSQVKMVNWFEWSKFEVEVNEVVDWTVTRNSNLSAAFKSALPTNLRFAGRNVMC
jgi:hypothetical protein